MATTVVAPVGNSIALAQKYLPLIDEVYKAASKTAILDTANDRVRWIGADTVKMLALSELGMGDYSRNAGFVPGDTTATWETFQITQDRGRSYQIDVMDNDETLGQIVGNLLGEVERIHIVPELDAYRFAKMAGTAGIDGATGDITVGTTNVKTLISAAEASMTNNEVPEDGRILFISPRCKDALKGNIERRIINSEANVSYEVEYFDNMRVITVPQNRFCTSITLAQPSAHDGAGGYTPGGKRINFMIVHPSAVMQVVKHVAPRLFSPAQNIEADAWRLNYRIYHDCFVLPNKKKGIYLYSDSTASN